MRREAISPILICWHVPAGPILPRPKAGEDYNEYDASKKDLDDQFDVFVYATLDLNGSAMISKSASPIKS